MAIDVIPCSLLNVDTVIDVIDAISHIHSMGKPKQTKKIRKVFNRNK